MKKMKSILRGLGKFLIVVGTTIAIIVIALLAMIFILVKGPSDTAKVLFVSSVNETSAIGFLADIFLSDEEVEAILNSNTMSEVEEGTVSDTTLITVDEDEDSQDIEIIDISGGTYKGKLMIVKDPSRVFVGTVPTFYEGNGMVVSELADKYDAVGGVNGGEFVDMGSYSYTAMPVGGVISNGEHVYGNLNTVYNLSGFTNDNVFVIGKMSVAEALEMGMRDCVHVKYETGPFLVLDGEALTVPDTSVYGGGKNPRTAIGQRADGAVLLLVVDGRQANSLGATFKELAYIMLEYGAVNAAAMDGGTSTQMVYEGIIQNNPYSPTGPRRCPTAFLVK